MSGWSPFEIVVLEALACGVGLSFALLELPITTALLKRAPLCFDILALKIPLWSRKRILTSKLVLIAELL